MKIGEREFQLPKEFGEKWVKVLRSGKYKQGTGFLLSRIPLNSKTSRDNTYCCLGVACAIVGFTKRDLGDNGFIMMTTMEKVYDSPLIPSLLKGNDTTNKFVQVVSSMNDSGKTFEEIADWIEENVELVEKPN